MTLKEIQTAVLTGKTVHWATHAYRIISDPAAGWLVWCDSTHHGWGLVRNDGTVNGRPWEFFVAAGK